MQTDLDINALVGRKILSAEINQEKDLVVLDTDHGKLYLTWVGDCCTNCYLAHFSGADALVGSIVNSVEDTKWDPKEESGGVTETMGTTIVTSKGYVTFESRAEHNGYYGGWINVSSTGPVDQYRRVSQAIVQTKPLEDF